MELIIYLTNKIGQYYEKNKNYKKTKHFYKIGIYKFSCPKSMYLLGMYYYFKNENIFSVGI